VADLKETIGELNKHFGKNTIISGNQFVALQMPRVSTGSLGLDIETGGGFPYGRVIEVYGKESAGKTFIALKTAANVQNDGKNVVWIDAEGSFDPVWSKKLGVDVENLYLARPESGEKAGDIMDAVIRSGDCGLVVLDSTAALIPEQDLDKSMGDVEQIGTRAKMVNRLVRKLHSALNLQVGEDQVPNNCMVIFINQIREKVGVMWGSPETTPGGLGLKHAASVRVHLRKSWIKDPKDKDKILGQSVTFVTEKNKTYPPYRRGEFDFFTEGELQGQIDNTKEVFTYGLLAGLIETTGRSYMFGDEKIVGRDAAVEYLRTNPKLEKELWKKISNHYFGGDKK